MILKISLTYEPNTMCNIFILDFLKNSFLIDLYTISFPFYFSTSFLYICISLPSPLPSYILSFFKLSNRNSIYIYPALYLEKDEYWRGLRFPFMSSFRILSCPLRIWEGDTEIQVKEYCLIDLRRKSKIKS